MTDHSPELIRNNRSIAIELKDKLLKAFEPHLKNKRAIFIDYPMHLNIGDLLIQEGTEYLFKALNVNVLARISERTQNRLFNKSIDPCVVLVLHGGGNFGDLYPHHQQLREQVIASFPNNKVLIMPQSVHYQNQQALIDQAPLYTQHKQLHVFVRDQDSYRLLKEHLPSTNLDIMPDMAFLIDDLWQKQTLTPSNVLIFRRRDIESTQLPDDNSASFDWDDVFSQNDRRFYKLIRKLARAENKYKLNLGVAHMWLRFSRRIIDKAIKHYQPYDTIDTDRLHGMILALLTGRHVIKQDNTYGKLARFAQCWLESQINH